MRHKIRIIKDFKRASNAALLSRCNNVFKGMGKNELFPQPPVKMEEFKQVIDLFDAGMVDAQHRDRLKAAQKNAVITRLIGMLDQLADYVTAVANGDEAILLASGFAISGSSASSSFGPVENFTVKIGQISGQVIISVKRIPGATTYAIYYGVENGENTVWLHAMKPKTRYVLSGLQPGKTYLFKMKVVGTNERETESEIITKVVA